MEAPGTSSGASAGRSRQRNGNNNERPAVGPSVTCNNDRDTSSAKQAHGFYSKIFRQYLPSSFNLSHSLARSGGSGSSKQLASRRTKSLQQKLDDDDDDDDDDGGTSAHDEKVNFAKRSKNNADEADDCRLRGEALIEPRRDEGGKTEDDHQQDGSAAGETALGRRELAIWPASQDQALADGGNYNTSRPDAADKQQQQRKVFGSQKRNNNQRRKIESSSSTTTTTTAAGATAAGSLNYGLKSIANAFSNRLRAPSASGCSADSLKLFPSAWTTTAAARNDPENHHLHRQDRARNQNSLANRADGEYQQTRERTGGAGGGQESDDCASEARELHHRQRQLELVLERRRNELREQLSKYKEQVRTDSSSSGKSGGVKRKGFLHLKRTGGAAATFAANANSIIRLTNSTSDRETHLESTSALLEQTDQNDIEYQEETRVALHQQQQQQLQQPEAEELKIRRDQNNNNNNNDDEMNARHLLIELSLSEREQVATRETESEHDCRIHKSMTDQSKYSSSSTIRQRPMASSASKQRMGPGGSANGLRAGGGSAVLLTLMLSLVVFCLAALGSQLGAQLALAQHQPPPFTRSQPMMLQATGQHGMSPQAGSRSGPLPLSPAQLPPQQQQPQHQQPQQHLPPPQSLQQQQQQQQQPQSQQQQQQQPNPLPATGSLVANINCNKIRGHVTLTPNLQGGTTVTTQITAGPPGEVYQWSIHQFPIKPGAAMCSCSALILGSKLVDLSEMHGNLPSDQEFSVQSSLPLFGFDSPVGHSLLLRGLKTGMVACGTFLPTSRKSNYRAKFHTPLSGSVTVFQTAFGTSFLAHLMYSNGSRRHSMHRFDILRSDDDIITTSLLNGQQASGSNLPPSSNFNQIEQREHENELQACRRFSSGEPLFKNLTYQLSVSTENFGMRGRTALVLPQIPFETFSSVYVVVYSEHDPHEPIACAPLRFVKPKTAAAKFQTVSVQGQIVFTQDSPYDVTVARVNLNFPNSDGHSYGIDELPMIIRRKSDTRVCPNIREIIYNPHHIEPSSVPPEGEATSDQYAVGDLSGKYGSLTGKQSEKITVNDHNLPLFGPVSIIGRALTIYSADGVAIACSNVELTSPMTTAFATFDFGIQGQFIFRQQMNDCNGDTYVYIEVSKPTTSNGGNNNNQQSAVASLAGAGNSHADHQLRSLDHNWHIHEGPVDSGLDHLSTTECSAAGGHFNPYNTSTSSIYSRDCTPFNVLRCELGDLSSKMFTIEIPPYKVKSGGQEPDIGKFFGTDIDLPLCGPVSIVNKSVVVHVADFGTQRLACSTVIEFKPRT